MRMKGGNGALPNMASTGTMRPGVYETAIKGGNCGAAQPSILKGGRRRKSAKKNKSKKARKTVRWFW